VLAGLHGDGARFINGQILASDGGLIMVGAQPDVATLWENSA
jgi:hypothetical protein